MSGNLDDLSQLQFHETNIQPVRRESFLSLRLLAQGYMAFGALCVIGAFLAFLAMLFSIGKGHGYGNVFWVIVIVACFFQAVVYFGIGQALRILLILEERTRYR